jgi:hypothetical protein
MRFSKYDKYLAERRAVSDDATTEADGEDDSSK